MIAGEALAEPEVTLGSAAELAGVPVAREQERVRDLAPELAWHVHELHQADDGRLR